MGFFIPSEAAEHLDIVQSPFITALALIYTFCLCWRPACPLSSPILLLSNFFAIITLCITLCRSLFLKGNKTICSNEVSISLLQMTFEANIV